MSQELELTEDDVKVIELQGGDDRPSNIALRSEDMVDVPGFDFSAMPQLVEVAKFMAQSQQGVPKPFRNQPGLCLAVAIQSHQWGFNPYGVAQNAYVVNDKVAYEAKVIKAALDKAGILIEPMSFDFEEKGDKRFCIATGRFLNRLGELTERVLETPPIGSINPKNSPLWTTFPDQQLCYYAARAWARRYAPGVMLGVYSTDELEYKAPIVNHRGDGNLAAQLGNATGKINGGVDETEEDDGAKAEAPQPEPSQEGEAAETSEGSGDEETGADQADRKIAISIGKDVITALKTMRSRKSADALLKGIENDGRMDLIEHGGADVKQRFLAAVDEALHEIEEREEAR